MSIDFRLAIEGRLAETIAADQKKAAVGYTRGIRLATMALKLALRQDMLAAGLGERLGNTWRGKVYPEHSDSLSAAGAVWSKASKIVLAQEGMLIRSRRGGRAWLAIPTENCPPRRRGGGFGSKGSKASPFEVETIFNQDLKFIPARRGVMLAYVEAVAARNKKGWRPPTKGRTRGGRKKEKVIMFIMVPQVRLRRRLDVEATFARVAATLVPTVAREVERELAT